MQVFYFSQLILRACAIACTPNKGEGMTVVTNAREDMFSSSSNNTHFVILFGGVWFILKIRISNARIVLVWFQVPRGPDK